MSETPKRLTVEEAEAVLTLVRGGWLRLVPTFGDDDADRGA